MRVVRVRAMRATLLLVVCLAMRVAVTEESLTVEVRDSCGGFEQKEQPMMVTVTHCVNLPLCDGASFRINSARPQHGASFAEQASSLSLILYEQEDCENFVIVREVTLNGCMAIGHSCHFLVQPHFPFLSQFRSSSSLLPSSSSLVSSSSASSPPPFLSRKQKTLNVAGSAYLQRLNFLKQMASSSWAQREEDLLSADNLARSENKVALNAFRSLQDELEAKRLTNLKHCLIPVPLMFVHLAKTAGTALFKSFRFAFWQHFNREVVQFWDTRDAQFWQQYFHKTTADTAPMMIGGHLTHGFHRVYFADEQENSQFSYITFLRHPVSRVWSHYTYHRQGVKDPNWIFAQNKTLHQWLQTMEFGRDAMTAYLSGAVPGAWWNEGLSIPRLPSRPNPDKPDIDNPNPGYSVTERHFELALANLRRMGFVGLHEKLAQSVEMLGNLLGITILFGVPHPAPSEMPPDYAELIERYNPYDMRLYREAEALFQQQSELLAISCQGKRITADFKRRFE